MVMFSYRAGEAGDDAARRQTASITVMAAATGPSLREEVAKAGGAPVEEGPPITPEEALDSTSRDDSPEQRPDSDPAGHEPHPAPEPAEGG